MSEFMNRSTPDIDEEIGGSAADITRRSRTNFLVSFALLPRPKREAITTVYAFCRCTDDIVDDEAATEVKRERLARWRSALERGFRGESAPSLLRALVAVARRFDIPPSHFFDLITGMQMDLERTRYATFEELRGYCWHVASTVGLMCSRIFGATRPSTEGYAVDLGIALQLTNIVRDVKSDAEMGRVYIPHEDFVRFGYSEEDLLASVYDERFVALMRFETERARAYYRSARAQLAGEDHRAFFAARIMDRIYSRILDTIEARAFAVFAGKISISPLCKLRLAIGEFLQRRPRPVALP